MAGMSNCVCGRGPYSDAVFNEQDMHLRRARNSTAMRTCEVKRKMAPQGFNKAIYSGLALGHSMSCSQPFQIGLVVSVSQVTAGPYDGLAPSNNGDRPECQFTAVAAFSSITLPPGYSGRLEKGLFGAFI